jgi:hypothetical protein
VLGDLPDIKWSVFKKPYNFHLELNNIQEVSFANLLTSLASFRENDRTVSTPPL